MRVKRIIGANMSARRELLVSIGGFHSDNHDDMDLCSRARARHGENSVWYEPKAVVYHHVGPERLKWRYFWRRCFNVNRGKVAAIVALEEAGDRGADFEFAKQTLLRTLGDSAGAARRGNLFLLARPMAALAGLALAALGQATGTVQSMLPRTNSRRSSREVQQVALSAQVAVNSPPNEDD
jgi:hypothetical protein